MEGGIRIGIGRRDGVGVMGIAPGRASMMIIVMMEGMSGTRGLSGGGAKGGEMIIDCVTGPNNVITSGLGGYCCVRMGTYETNDIEDMGHDFTIILRGTGKAGVSFGSRHLNRL